MKISPNLINLMELNDVLMFYKGKIADTSAKCGFRVVPTLKVNWPSLRKTHIRLRRNITRLASSAVI